MLLNLKTLNSSFHGFKGQETNLTTEGASIIKPNGLLWLTNRSNFATGHAFYTKPVPIINRSSSSSSSPNAYSFSTSFVFCIIPPGSGRGGHGFAFILSPSKQLPGAQDEHYLGIFNESNDGNSSNHIFAVEFDTVKGYNEPSDSEGNHVGININGMLNSEATRPAAYSEKGNEQNERDIKLESGDPILAWIEYDGQAKVVNVTISPATKAKPSKPLITLEKDLTSILLDSMYVGFSASTGDKSSSHYILGWSFSTKGVAPPLNLSQLPEPPPKEKSDPSSFKPQVTAVIATLSVLTIILLGSLFVLTLYKRGAHARHEILEDWELDCPHRFKYRDLYAATKGFEESEVIGVGGFGAVYKGILPATGSEVAVKKIVRTSTRGMREFAAEIESLGRLRHKNLVNLQGWCKHKNDLLIVYDYIPNGSLDSLIYKPKNNFVLSWEKRFSILKGIASGLLYLHEEWEQVVIHRDVKSSNVLIDGEMNPRLGDFGLARLYDHDKLSHTTNVVGTIGYIAPELARSGKVSTSSDVFAYGVLLLEVATGRRPVESSNFILVDWVMESYQMRQILDPVDPGLNTIYVVEEVELVLELGLLCSHPRPGARPTMRQVTRYLSGDEPLPTINDDWSSLDSHGFSEMNSRMLEGISITNSYLSSSTNGGISTSSINRGR
ncbi:lectin-domain containing receptor kinase VI.3-like isoform X2 [Juglans microcarpa x Juglans regia]|uniref:lectin-domain containing receptor kinase VI.3-like isoform X2 n=1 Tax=Juglans microcarpa x Juglans regia TaxID=2249226 RepID=UPI001B7E416A|nr:lectin-domain containing receptor kinase VI.3-like isoform X2 [Juglans microcarpa x Juglans regia]